MAWPDGFVQHGVAHVLDFRDEVVDIARVLARADVLHRHGARIGLSAFLAPLFSFLESFDALEEGNEAEEYALK